MYVSFIVFFFEKNIIPLNINRILDIFFMIRVCLWSRFTFFFVWIVELYSFANICENEFLKLYYLYIWSVETGFSFYFVLAALAGFVSSWKVLLFLRTLNWRIFCFEYMQLVGCFCHFSFFFWLYLNLIVLWFDFICLSWIKVKRWECWYQAFGLIWLVYFNLGAVFSSWLEYFFES